MAVDGDLSTSWQTAKATGANKPLSEMITVDLGSVASIGTVVLEWDSRYAIDYVIQVSVDNNNWSTVATITGGDGGRDEISLGSVSAQYVRLEATNWTSDAFRLWLNEFELYAPGTMPPGPAAVQQTSTANTVASGTTSTETTLAFQSGTDSTDSFHISNLADVAYSVGPGVWQAAVLITAQDNAGNPVAGATVTGDWGGDYSGSASCVTGADGRCHVDSALLTSSVRELSFTVTGATHAQLTYQPAYNQDADGDSDGTTIVVSRP
jgi:hypothetical protein